MSGGQTGVNRAALDVGLALGLAVGGGCPQGRRAEDGRISDRYPLVETLEPGKAGTLEKRLGEEAVEGRQVYRC